MDNKQIIDGKRIAVTRKIDGHLQVLLYEDGNAFMFNSSGKQNVDVTGLTLKNVSGLTVYARGYVVYMMNGEEGILLSDVVSETAE